MKDNRQRYRKLSQPHENRAAAEDKIRQFINVLEAAREEYGIPDLVLMLSVNVSTEDGDEVSLGTDCEWGNSSEWALMAARLYGLLKDRMIEDIALAAKGRRS